ncbi:hypothetical protein [Blastococcus colisei]|uniref:hypothetical protein n=1 Tax=Blastococcus colisei TaxID=1564162 RepID=UPI00114EC978|nr:hypothetical protein [Blastococcus colisei]
MHVPSGQAAADDSDGTHPDRFVRALTPTCEAAARGDLEARSCLDPAMDTVPELPTLHDAPNRTLDVSGAFAR